MNRNKEPWSVRGRWYSIFIESDAGAYQITDVDKRLETATITASGVLTLPEDFILTAYKTDITSQAGASGDFTCGLTDNHYVLTLPAGADHGYIYCYGYFK